MRIVHLSTVHRTRDNRIYNKECGGLLSDGYDVRLVVRAEHDENDPVPIAALPAPRNRIQRLTLTQLQAWRKLNSLRPDLLHIHDPELIPMARLWGSRHKVAWIFDAHEHLVDQIDTKPYLKPWQRRAAKAYAAWLTRQADQHADGIVAATERIADQYRNRNVGVVHNYPWLRDFVNEPAPVPGRLVYTGDLTEERRFSFMVQVAHRLREMVDHAHLVLAGSFRGRSGISLQGSIDGDVVRHLGLLPPAQVPDVIASASVGLIFLDPLPNYLTSLPTKVFEYMASSVPFAASDFAHWKASFGTHEAGIFVDSSDAQAAATALASIITDPTRLASMGRAGRLAVEQYYNFEGELDQLLTVVERAVG